MYLTLSVYTFISLPCQDLPWSPEMIDLLASPLLKYFTSHILSEVVYAVYVLFRARGFQFPVTALKLK